MMKILLVEDDDKLAGLIKEYLEGHQFEVVVEPNGATAVETIIQHNPELVVLDLMLPGKDGITICREVRPQFAGPILMLTASMDSVDEILGLEIGADDYVQKPVEPRTLLARIRALLRRVSDSGSNAGPESPSGPEILQFDQLSINKSARTVQLGDVVIELNNPEYELLLYLAERAGTTVSRDELFQSLRKLSYDGQSRIIDITMSQVRKKFGSDVDRYLKTVRGKGYLFMLHES
ncbi:MAG: response regulator [Pseudomonadales bacterium]|nr:response regulator [Pseudomonadales bacterium]